MGELAANYDHAVSEDKLSYDHRQKNAEASRDREAQDASQETESAMKRQAQTYQAELDRQAGAHRTDARVWKGQKERLQQDAADPSRVHPEVEERLRQDFAAHNLKLLESDIARNRTQSERLQDNFNVEVQKQRADHDSEAAQNQRTFNSERQLDRNTYLNHVQEIEKAHQQSQNDQQVAINHQLEGTRRSYFLVLEQQKREYDRLLQQAREDGATRYIAARQDADAQLRMAHQEQVAQTNAMSRDYEKKLQDQKVEHDVEVDEMKGQLVRDKSEAERRTHQLLDEQAHQFEQKIAQIEFQTKERERMISDNYQDQMDRMKRAHALQQQKKS